MHEFSFAEQILASVLRKASEFEGARVCRIRLRAGKLLALDRASLAFCFEAISSGTPVEGAVIELTEIGAELLCTRCGTVPLEDPGDPRCPQCGQEGRLAPPMDLVVEEIEITDEVREDGGEGPGEGPGDRR